MQMSDELKRQLNALSQEVAPDCKDMDAEGIAEICLDASRLTMAGYPELDEEASRLRDEHGYPALLEEAAKHVSVW